MEKPGHILIVDDHPLVRRGLKELLAEQFPGIRLHEAGDAVAALELADALPLDLATVDINLPGRDGLELLRELRRLHPRLRVLVVSAFPEDEFAVRALKMGAAGYVAKDAASDVLAGAVRSILSGRHHIGAGTAERLARAVAEGWSGAPHELLSHRELQVLRRIAAGRTIKEIAAELALSDKTIATYRTRISEKLGVTSAVDLTRYALRHRLAG
jgi:DNA-binding NarL/FixJ family response regulator